MKKSKAFSFLLGAALLALMPVAVAAQPLPNSDLEIVSNTANVRHSHVGQQVTFPILARNNGPDATPSLFVTATFQGLQLVREICALGVSPDTPSCEYSNIRAGQELTTTVVAEVLGTADQREKTAALMACVSSGEPINDPNSNNNCITSPVKIVGRR